eukprot:TRINITY_DN12035_c0_g1_i1.p1 TRINITY_DN12035_c0_g1~~TRINITY_DN12035_c0_g1_i1.p1  ORF type:complete len:326 (+),score=58.01 TRINITY_DN12035_c0_g1_i1:95-979(+)
MAVRRKVDPVCATALAALAGVAAQAQGGNSSAAPLAQRGNTSEANATASPTAGPTPLGSAPPSAGSAAPSPQPQGGPPGPPSAAPSAAPSALASSVGDYLAQARSAGDYGYSLLPRCFAAGLDRNRSAAAQCWLLLFASGGSGLLAREAKLRACVREACGCRGGAWAPEGGFCANLSDGGGCDEAAVRCARRVAACVGTFLPAAVRSLPACTAAALGQCATEGSPTRRALSSSCSDGAWHVGLPAALLPDWGACRPPAMCAGLGSPVPPVAAAGRVRHAAAGAVLAAAAAATCS